MNIPNYILKKEKGHRFRSYFYLHIHGGSGIKNGRQKFRLGGEFDYILFYASPEQMEGLDKCSRLWCEEKKIPYGEGKTIEEAWENYPDKSIVDN